MIAAVTMIVATATGTGTGTSKAGNKAAPRPQFGPSPGRQGT